MIKPIFDTSTPRDEVLRGELKDEIFPARLKDVIDENMVFPISCSPPDLTASLSFSPIWNCLLKLSMVDRGLSTSISMDGIRVSLGQFRPADLFAPPHIFCLKPKILKKITIFLKILVLFRPSD